MKTSTVSTDISIVIDIVFDLRDLLHESWQLNVASFAEVEADLNIPSHFADEHDEFISIGLILC